MLLVPRVEVCLVEICRSGNVDFIEENQLEKICECLEELRSLTNTAGSTLGNINWSISAAPETTESFQGKDSLLSCTSKDVLCHQLKYYSAMYFTALFIFTLFHVGNRKK